MKFSALLLVPIFFLIACGDDERATGSLTIRVGSDTTVYTSPSRVAATREYCTPATVQMAFTHAGIATTADGTWRTVFDGSNSCNIASDASILANAISVDTGTIQGVRIAYSINWFAQGSNPINYSCTNSDSEPTNFVYCVTADVRDIITNAPYNVSEDYIHLLSQPITINEGDSITATLQFNIQDLVWYMDYGAGDLRDFEVEDIGTRASLIVN